MKRATTNAMHTPTSIIILSETFVAINHRQLLLHLTRFWRNDYQNLPILLMKALRQICPDRNWLLSHQVWDQRVRGSCLQNNQLTMDSFQCATITCQLVKLISNLSLMIHPECHLVQSLPILGAALVPYLGPSVSWSGHLHRPASLQDCTWLHCRRGAQCRS